MRGTLAVRLDTLIYLKKGYLKKGYSALKHLVPFLIAALLLLTLSVPADNLLLKLANLLQRPSWVWLPAGLLTLVAMVVYGRIIYVQVRQAYLWPDHDRRRTISTSLMYVVLCSLMAFGVLQLVSTKTEVAQDITLGNVWACFLIAVLSLTGLVGQDPVPGRSLQVSNPQITRKAVHPRRR